MSEQALEVRVRAGDNGPSNTRNSVLPFEKMTKLYVTGLNPGSYKDPNDDKIVAYTVHEDDNGAHIKIQRTQPVKFVGKSVDQIENMGFEYAGRLTDVENQPGSPVSILTESTTHTKYKRGLDVLTVANGKVSGHYRVHPMYARK